VGFNPLRQRLPAATVREHGGRGECPAGISNGVYKGDEGEIGKGGVDY